MRELRFSLRITNEQYLDYYKGFTNHIVATTHNGQKIQFPAGALKPFLTHEGISGNFRILYSDENKLVRIERI